MVQDLLIPVFLYTADHMASLYFLINCVAPKDVCRRQCVCYVQVDVWCLLNALMHNWYVVSMD